MGYPHPSHPKETVVLSRYFGDPGARTYDGWVQRGGYEALRRVEPEALNQLLRPVFLPAAKKAAIEEGRRPGATG